MMVGLFGLSHLLSCRLALRLRIRFVSFRLDVFVGHSHLSLGSLLEDAGFEGFGLAHSFLSRGLLARLGELSFLDSGVLSTERSQRGKGRVAGLLAVLGDDGSLGVFHVGGSINRLVHVFLGMIRVLLAALDLVVRLHHLLRLLGLQCLSFPKIMILLFFFL